MANHIIKVVSICLAVTLIGTFIVVLHAAVKRHEQTVSFKKNVEEKKKQGNAQSLAAALKNVVQYNVMGAGSCSGTIISKTLMITAAHCVPDEMSYIGYVMATGQQPLVLGGTSLALTPIIVDRRLDRALLKGNFSNFEPIKVDHLEGKLFTAKLFYVCGYPGENKNLRCTKATFVHYFEFAAAVDTNIIPGQSGGGVFTEDGVLVGSVSGMVSNPENLRALSWIQSTVGLVPQERTK